MRINLMSSFAAGILITTTICGAVYFTSGSDDQKASAKSSETKVAETVQLSEGEMKEKLEAAGFVVLTKEDYEKALKEAKGSDQNEAPAEESKTVTKVIVNVADGMTSIDVGNVLVGAGLIPNAFEFSKNVESKGVENKLRPGVYVVDSQMSIDDVIATIFK
ncbi:aminodeoxychorismate lyase [Neobacillus sp. K501]